MNEEKLEQSYRVIVLFLTILYTALVMWHFIDQNSGAANDLRSFANIVFIGAVYCVVLYVSVKLFYIGSLSREAQSYKRQVLRFLVVLIVCTWAFFAMQLGNPLNNPNSVFNTKE
jgi:hypothetical protein